MSRLAGWQTKVKNECYEAWDQGARCVMPVVSTGGGKTVIVGEIAREHDGYGLAQAHRSELVSQISTAMAREGVRHDIIAPAATIRQIVAKHLDEIGRSYYDARSNWKVASVDTILRRDLDERWRRQVSLVIQDEGHHVQRENKWGRAFSMFPMAKGLFPTATPERADGGGLGSGDDNDGLVDRLIEGPKMRWMIENRYLTPYKALGISTDDLDMTGVELSKTGDFNHAQAAAAVKKSKHIVGDVVAAYLAHARGKLGITFAVDVEHATTLAAAYNAAGVPAVVVHADTPAHERNLHMQRFVKREILQLVNVDLFGEGVDVPVLEVVSFARPTASYSLYVQQFGRVLRLMISPILRAAWDSYTIDQRTRFLEESGKSHGIILDHVGNIILHGGPPDYRQHEWSLERRSKRTRAMDTVPMRSCTNHLCLQHFERWELACPFCGTVPPPPADRSQPKYVDGDLMLYTPELLAQMFGEIENVNGPCVVPYSAQPAVKQAVRNMHANRQHAQQRLRALMGLLAPPGVDPRVSAKKFFLTYGVDTLTAQALGSTDADKLRQRIIERISGQ